MGDKQANGAAQTEDEITPALPVQPSAAPLTQEEPKAVAASDPFPWRILIVLYFVIVSDGMAMQIIGPFLSQLCQDRWGISMENVGFAAGFLFGAYSFAAFLTSFMIGYLSDLFGRKKLMLVGLCSAAICTLGVVMVPNYWLAVGLRFLAGSTNSNVALSRAVIADITKGQNRVLGFAYLGAAFSFSRLIASIIGGLAAGHYLPFGLLAGNPYALPSLIGTIFNVASFIMAFTFIPETLSQAQKNKTKDPKTALVEGIKYIAGDSVLRNLILGFALNSVTNGSLILALYVYYTLALDVHGLAFTPAEMGLTFSCFGLCALCFQTLLFERFLKRMKIVRLYGMGLSVMSVSTFAVPTGGLIYWWFGKTATTQIFSYLHTCVCFIGLAVGFMTCLPVMGTMISNAADAERQGLTQGTNQSIAALFRALGPFVAGSIFSFSVSLSFPFLLFWFLGAVNLACLVLLRALPPHGIARVSEERPAGGHQEMRPLAQNDSEKEAAAAAERSVEVTANEEEESESAPALEVVRDTDNNAKERN